MEDLKKYQNAIENALKNGIDLNNNGVWVKAPGTIALIWHPVEQCYCFVFGTCQENAGYVPVKSLDENYWR